MSYGELGIKLNKGNNLFTTDTPQRTARHVIDSCLRGGDFEDFMGYYQCYRLFWLKQYIENMLQHFQRCVKDFPTLHWLLYKTIHHTVTSIYEQPL